MGAPFVIYICVFYTLFTASIILHFISSRVGCANGKEECSTEKDADEEADEEGTEKEREKRGESTRCISSSISPKLPAGTVNITRRQIILNS